MGAPFPERIGRYDLLLPIASGGMGTVYLARATSIGGFEREVALKVMHAHLKADSEFASDLLEEAKLTVRIRHPNVVSVLDVGDDPFGIYLVMDYVAGDTLAGIQHRAKPLPRRIGMKLLLDALTGLHVAHELKDDAGRPSNLVHRDFSPQNILVGTDGIGRLSDFGVARAAMRVTKTSTGVIKGKIAYMSPEQARGEAIDRRTDVWAAGVVAWQLVTGNKLHARSDNEAALLLKVATRAPPRTRDVDPSVPAALDDAIARALAWKLDERFETAHAFRQALTSACAGDIADVDEVGAFLTTLLTPVLAEQRRRIVQIVELRTQVGALAAPPSSDASQSTAPPDDDTLFTARTDGTRSNVSTDFPAQKKKKTSRLALFGGAVALAIAAATTGAVVGQRRGASVSATTAPSVTHSVETPGTVTSSPVIVDLDETPGATARETPAATVTTRPKSMSAVIARTTANGILPESPYHADAGAHRR